MIYLNVTNSFITKSHTGIQRVVKELTSRLVKQDDYTLVVSSDDSFYRLVDDSEISDFLNAKEHPCQHKLDISSLGSSDVFCDLDASWGDRYDMEQLYLSMKKRGVILVKMHYDAVPILFSEFSHQSTVFRYIENFSAALSYVDHWICISKTVERDLHAISADLGLGAVWSDVINLGSDIRLNNSNQNKLDERYEEILQRDYMLAVGTVEPRKNYDLTLDVFDALSDKNTAINLVIVGKSGWDNQKLVKRIFDHPLFKKRLHWFDSADDFALDALYRKARVCLCLSHYEGYGLPVSEALLRKTPVICTSGGAMEEIGEGYAKSVSPDTASVLAALDQFLAPNPVTRIENYSPTLWDDSATQIHHVFQKIQDNAGFATEPYQAVYISIRPEALRRSILSIERNMPFIRQVVILTSDAHFEIIEQALEDISLEKIILRESDIGLYERPEDHQQRNTFLRYHFYKTDFIGENFIALDDDNLIIEPIDVSNFISDGKHNAFYFEENGTEWLGAHNQPTSFDVGLWQTVHFLKSSGYDTKLYNSHQPQIINKQMAVKILERSQSGLPLDEWSSYFNIAKHLKPNTFVDTLYQCAGWPARISWHPVRIPAPIRFYNDYPLDKPISEAAASAIEWVNELDKAMTKSANVSPTIPSLFISSESVAFNHEQIHCAADAVLFIPILSSEPLNLLQYSFLNRNVTHQGDNIPNFLYVPLRNTGTLTTIELNVTLRTANTDAAHTAVLTINI